MLPQAETDYLPARRQELLDLAARYATADGVQATAVPGLYLIREPDVSQPLSTVYEPSLCLVLQGAKTVVLETEQYRYDASSFLIVSVHLPTKGQIVEASPDRPYLCVKISFHAEDIWQLLQGLGPVDSRGQRPLPALWLWADWNLSWRMRCCGMSGCWSARRTSLCWRRSSTGKSCTGCFWSRKGAASAGFRCRRQSGQADCPGDRPHPGSL